MQTFFNFKKYVKDNLNENKIFTDLQRSLNVEQQAIITAGSKHFNVRPIKINFPAWGSIGISTKTFPRSVISSFSS